MNATGRDDKCLARARFFVIAACHNRIFVTELFFDETLEFSLKSKIIEATLFVAWRDNAVNNVFNIEDLFAEAHVFDDTFMDRLSRLRVLELDITIRSRPSMIAINPPVPPPPIKSKYSQGRGFSAPLSLPISSIISRKIKRAD